METGVWTGGQSMTIAAVMKLHGVSDRTQWLCDSFIGLPIPAARYKIDLKGMPFWEMTRHNLHGPGVTQANFERVGLLRAGFPQQWEVGFFNETMPALVPRVKKLAMLRLDGDMFQSTWEVLLMMAPKVQVGGWIVVDDYSIKACKYAVDRFRNFVAKTRSPMLFPKLPVLLHQFNHHIDSPHQGAYWKVNRPISVPLEMMQEAFPHLSHAQLKQIQHENSLAHR